MRKITAFLVGILVCVLTVSIKGFPEMPISDPMMSSIVYDADVKGFLADNFFAVTLFISSVNCGLFLMFYGFYAKIKTRLSFVSNASGILGAIVITAGIWILTDSRFFLVFRKTPGKTNYVNGIALISFLSFLLLPVIYSEFIKCFVKRKRLINILENLMVVNIIAFLVLSVLSVNPIAYLVVLFIHHALIVILIAMNIKLYFRYLFRGQNVTQHNFAMGTIAFGITSVIALGTFMFGKYRMYPIIYGIGLMILIFFMVKMLFAEISEIRRAQVQVELYKEMAYTDTLTGLPNRNAFIRDTDNVTDLENLGVIIMDINNLKIINDTYGHESGDMIITVASDVIRNAYVDVGVGYRIGGDEFAVLCHNIHETEIKTAISNAENLQFEFNNKNGINLNIASGYAVNSRETEIKSFKSLMKTADKRMYADKLEKKNRL